MALRIKAAVRTDAGRSRDNNEDNFYLDGTYLEREEMDAGGGFAVDASTACALFAVCDGMGGQEKGEEASYATVRVMDALRDALGAGEAENVRALIDEYCGRANSAVYALDGGGSAGTTFAGLCFYDDQAFCASLGDSRIYVLRDRKLMRISADHTEAAHLVQEGYLTEMEAQRSVYSHIVTRYIGMPPSERPFHAAHYPDFVLHYGDRFLLCSDGLTDMLEDAEIRDIMLAGGGVNETVGALVQAALEHGGRDNVTVLVAEVERETNPAADAEQLWERLESLEDGEDVFARLTQNALGGTAAPVLDAAVPPIPAEEEKSGFERSQTASAESAGQDGSVLNPEPDGELETGRTASQSAAAEPDAPQCGGTVPEGETEQPEEPGLEQPEEPELSAPEGPEFGDAASTKTETETSEKRLLFDDDSTAIPPEDLGMFYAPELLRESAPGFVLTEQIEQPEPENGLLERELQQQEGRRGWKNRRK